MEQKSSKKARLKEANKNEWGESSEWKMNSER